MSQKPISRKSLILAITTFILLAALPAMAKVTVHFASTFDSSGDKLEKVWLVGVDCGDGNVQGAGVCADDPSKCAETAKKKICSGSTLAAGSGSEDERPDLIYSPNQTIRSLDLADARSFESLAAAEFSPSFVSDVTRPSARPPEWQFEIARRSQNLSADERALAVATIAQDVDDILGCQELCYAWGPGCPCWEGEDDWLEGPQPIFPIVAGIAAGVIFDLAQCAIRIEVDGYQAGEESPLEGQKGFDRLVECAFGSTGFTTGPSGTGWWTAWLNRDNPWGTGDFETLSDFVKAGTACQEPLDIECETLNGVSWRDAGQDYRCDPKVGGVCKNQGQECEDYRVRFLCK